MHAYIYACIHLADGWWYVARELTQRLLGLAVNHGKVVSYLAKTTIKFTIFSISSETAMKQFSIYTNFKKQKKPKAGFKVLPKLYYMKGASGFTLLVGFLLPFTAKLFRCPTKHNLKIFKLELNSELRVKLKSKLQKLYSFQKIIRYA